MSDNDDPVTNKQFRKFVQDLVDSLNQSQTCVYRRLDALDKKLGALDAKITSLAESMSRVRSNVSSVKRDAGLLPPIF